MPTLNWIFWKKVLFTSGILGLSITPIVLINKYSFNAQSLDVSPYKKNMEYLSGKYAKQFGIQDWAKEVFGIPEMKSGIEDVFAEELALLAVENSNLFRDRYGDLVREEQKEYEREAEGSHGKIFDSQGGSRSAMKRRALTSKAHEDFKKEMLEFDHNNFTFNRHSDTRASVKYGVHLSAADINQAKNWKHIGFFSRESRKDLFDMDFAKHKFALINFAHKVWFREVRPFYVWMSLWKHKEKPSKQELNSFWDLEKLKEKKVHVDNASYAFPYFDNKPSTNSTTQKFKNFFKNVVANYSSGSKIYIPKGYTEDSATSILVEGKNMYGNLYVRFAAAANHKYQEKLQEKKSSSSPQKTYINQRDKSHSVDGYKQPTELFMFQSSDSSSIKARVKVNKDMFKGSTYDNKAEIADLVEIKDTPWMFIRNRAGIHAMAVDVENMDGNQKDIYGHFQYRTFQALYKDLLSFTQTLDIKAENVIKSFRDFFEKNFNRILLKYVYENNAHTFFGALVPKDISNFSTTFTKGEEMNEVREKYLSRIKLRESLINTYVQTKWDVNETSNTFDYANISSGLAGMIPWKMKTDDPENGKENYVFEELEKVYDFDLFKDNNNPDNKKLSKEYEEKIKNYKTESEKYIDALGLYMDPNTSGSSSDRIFSNNYYINRINDKMLDKSEIFNEFLFKYIIKTDYLGKSILGQKGLVDINSDFGIALGDDLKSNNGGEVIANVTNKDDTENIKKVFGKIDEQVITNYYSRLLLENESNNPWEVAKYGGNALKTEQNKQKENLQKISKQAFADKFTFGEGDFRSKHYSFLTTLAYLTSNNFENLLKYLKTVVSHKNDSYIVFSKYSLSKNELKLQENSLQNPFLNRELDSNTTFNKDVKNIYKYFSQVNFSDSGNKVDSEFIYGGFYTDPIKNTANIPEKYKSRFDSDKLYRYGKDKQAFNTYVLSISSEDEFKRVVEKIKKAVKNDADRSWVDNLSKDQIYVTSTTGTTTKTIKILTLQEKKNLLSAYLNDVKVEINNDEIEKSKFKDVFLTDPDNSYNSTNQTHQKAQDSKLNEDKLKQYEDISEGNDKMFKLFQINSDDVKDFDSFKTYVNSKLSSDVFWAWIIDLALTHDVQELALQDLSSKSEKIEVFDSRWSSVGRDKFVRK